MTKKDYITVLNGPSDRNVFAEVPAGYATNIMVQDFEPGIVHTLRMMQAAVSLPALPGEVGRY